MEYKNQNFSFTYSAKEQDEVKKIREKYTGKEENKLELLRRLDQKVTGKATAASIAVGVIGTLIMGGGMSCVLVESIGLSVLGVILGVIGIAVAAFAYPVYNRALKAQKERYAPEIIRLSDELLK